MKKETFEKRGGTVNRFEEVLGPGNLLDGDFSDAGLPSSWGEQSGRVVVGPYSGGALWVNHEHAESPTGYHFSASFYICKDGLRDENANPVHRQAKRLDGAFGGVAPIPSQAGGPGIRPMLHDYPLIATEIIGSSGSSDGRKCVFLVDNVRWEELSRSSDAFVGSAGNDRLTGGAGASADVLTGLLGNDRYHVDNVADRVIEAAGEGNDAVYASVDYVLDAGQEIESLRANAGARGLTLVGTRGTTRWSAAPATTG